MFYNTKHRHVSLKCYKSDLNLLLKPVYILYFREHNNIAVFSLLKILREKKNQGCFLSDLIVQMFFLYSLSVFCRQINEFLL